MRIYGVTSQLVKTTPHGIPVLVAPDLITDAKMRDTSINQYVMGSSPIINRVVGVAQLAERPTTSLSSTPVLSDKSNMPETDPSSKGVPVLE